ncbi:MAG: GSCFA domain-containing protein [Acetobacterales bacterium]
MTIDRFLPRISRHYHQGRLYGREPELFAVPVRAATTAGTALLEKGDVYAAELQYRRALTARADDAEALCGLALSLYQQTRWSEAEELLKAVLAIRPGWRKAEVALGEVLLQLGRYREALSSFRDLVRALPENPYLRKRYNRIRKRHEEIEAARRSIRIENEPNAEWGETRRGTAISLQPNPVIRPDSRIFTMGSCFALEVRHELERRGFGMFPNYSALRVDPTRQKINALPDRNNLNYYDTFTIRQEFDQALEGRRYELEDFWRISGRPINSLFRSPVVFQDPYRKNVYGIDGDAILDASDQLSSVIAEGIEASDVYVITLGLTEAWQNLSNGMYVAGPPGGKTGGAGLCRLRLSTFADNYANLRRVMELISANFDNRDVILTVSPVALHRTFSGQDVIVASTESKSILRAVAGQLAREYPRVHYMPTYELFGRHDLYHEDGRHASRDGVEVVFDTLLSAFMEPTVERADIRELLRERAA